MVERLIVGKNAKGKTNGLENVSEFFHTGIPIKEVLWEQNKIILWIEAWNFVHRGYNKQISRVVTFCAMHQRREGKDLVVVGILTLILQGYDRVQWPKILEKSMHKERLCYDQYEQ